MGCGTAQVNRLIPDRGERGRPGDLRAHRHDHAE
jgi:hypothetical protein